MNSRLLLNVILLVIVIALGLTAWLRPGIEPAPEPQHLTDLDPETVSAIRIIGEEGQVGLLRRDKQWYVSGDPELPADPLQVNSLLRLASAEIKRHYPASELDLAALALDPAPITVRFDTTELAIGGTDPLENLRYVHSGNTVALLQDTFYTMLKGKRTNFASRRLLPEGMTIESIALPEITVSRDTEGHWKLDPERENVGADEIQSLVDSWTRAQALWVAESTEIPEGSNTVTITLTGVDTPTTWHIVAAENSTSLTRSDLGLKYEIGRGLGDRLLKVAENKPDDEAAPPALNTE